MDRQLLERMVGASLLVLAVVIIAPTILDGGEPAGSPDVVPARTADAPGMKTHTIRLDREPDRPPIAQAVQTPVPDSTAPAPAQPDRPAAAQSAKPEPAQAADKPEVSKVPRPVPVVSVEPKGQASASVKPPPADPAPVPAAANGAPLPAVASGWAVQLGAFSQADSAKRLEAKVQGRGFPAYVVTVELADKTLYRVRVGPEETRDQASRLVGKLSAAGFGGGQVISQKPGA